MRYIKPRSSNRVYKAVRAKLQSGWTKPKQLYRETYKEKIKTGLIEIGTADQVNVLKAPSDH